MTSNSQEQYRNLNEKTRIDSILGMIKEKSDGYFLYKIDINFSELDTQDGPFYKDGSRKPR